MLAAERRLGAMLAGMDMHGGDRGNQHTGGKVTSCDLGSHGITKMQSSRWQTEARVPGYYRGLRYELENWPQAMPYLAN